MKVADNVNWSTGIGCRAREEGCEQRNVEWNGGGIGVVRGSGGS
jgi:hypothetical protein